MGFFRHCFLQTESKKTPDEALLCARVCSCHVIAKVIIRKGNTVGTCRSGGRNIFHNTRDESKTRNPQGPFYSETERNRLELMEKACNRGFCLEAFVFSVMQEEMVSGKNKEGALVNQSVLYRATQGNIQEE